MATKIIAWNDGSGDYITLTYTGQGDGTVTVASPQNNGAARSATFDIRTTAGSPVVTRELTVTQGACPVPIGTVLNYAYTGSYQEVTLPAGQYKLQCWGARGGSNAAASSCGITAKAGGKGGYSEGVITLSSPTTVRVYVGGAGTSSKGGFNGGGSTTGSSTYYTADEYGTSRMGGGGGATDIRLSDGSLNSRMIVAGGGSGGSGCYKKATTSSTTWTRFSSGSSSGNTPVVVTSKYTYLRAVTGLSVDTSKTYRVKPTQTEARGSTHAVLVYFMNNGAVKGKQTISYGSYSTLSFPSGTIEINIESIEISGGNTPDNFSYVMERQDTTTSTSTSNDYSYGYVGGGTSGGGYASGFYGTQTSAGSGGSFGQGANQTAISYRYCSGAGGGGWYGGGRYYADNPTTYCKYSGGGSGWVNIAENASHRPSGYTGLELDSGKTEAGNVSFPSTSGGTETGHSGNGYAKITRLA